jgi:uncharacterized membrane protein
MKSVATVIISSLVILFIDGTYLSVFGQPFIEQTAKIQNSSFKLNLHGAIFSYLFIIFALNYFVLLKTGSLFDAFILGLVTYGIYDMTNLALFKQWDLSLAILDTIWGGTLFTLTTFLTYWILSILYP